MEPLPTVEDIYRDEFRLDEFITADLKALVKSFRKAYEKFEGVDFTSEPMKLSSSKEMRAMAVKFLEEGIAADRATKQKEVPAGNSLWVRARGSFMGYRVERTKILGSLGRLFARQNRYRDRNVSARGEQRRNETGEVPPAVEDPDLPDVDEILRAKEPTGPTVKDGEVPQTRSGRPYNNDPSAADANSSGADNGPTPLSAPTATMTQGLNWGCFASSGIDSKPAKDLNHEPVKPGRSVKPTAIGGDIPSEQPPRTTASNKKRHAYVTSDNEESDGVNVTKQDSVLAEALAASSDVTQGEVESIIEDAIRQMDPIQSEIHPPGRSTKPDQPPFKGSNHNSEQSNKRKHPEPVEFSHESTSDERSQPTETRTSGDKVSAVGERIGKKPKMTNKISDAFKVSKPKDGQTQMNNKATKPGWKSFTPAKDPDSIVPPLPPASAPSKAGGPSRVADFQSPSGDRRALSKPRGIHMAPRFGSRMLLSRQRPTRRESLLPRLVLRGHTLPPSLGERLGLESKSPETPHVDEHPNATSATDVQGPESDASPATGTKDTLEARDDRQMSQTLEPESLVESTEPQQFPIQSNDTVAPTRKPRIAVQLWILEARFPKVFWRQWAGASLNAQSVTSIFQMVDELSQFRNVDTAYVRFQTDEQVWTYTIRKDDPDQFEDMKRSITADIKATNRKNRNNNHDFKIYIEPVGGANTSGDEAMEEADDEIIPGLY